MGPVVSGLWKRQVFPKKHAGHALDSFTDDIRLQQEPKGSALPKTPIIRFRWEDGFAASLVRCFAAARRVAHPRSDLSKDLSLE